MSVTRTETIVNGVVVDEAEAPALIAEEHPYLDGWCWLDGPGFSDWLEQFVPRTTVHSDKDGWVAALRRRMYAWKYETTAVSIYTADPYLISLSLHPLQVPARLWQQESGRRGRRPWDARVKREALELRKRGVSRQEIRRRLGPTVHTISKWEQAA